MEPDSIPGGLEGGDGRMNTEKVTIVAGTTPTLIYRFRTISPQDIKTAYLTVQQGGRVIVKKDMATAEIGASTLSWTLTQADTLAISRGEARVMVNWVTLTGMRGTSPEITVYGAKNHIEKVI